MLQKKVSFLKQSHMHVTEMHEIFGGEWQGQWTNAEENDQHNHKFGSKTELLILENLEAVYLYMGGS